MFNSIFKIGPGPKPFDNGLTEPVLDEFALKQVRYEKEANSHLLKAF